MSQLSFDQTRPPLYFSGNLSVREADRVETDWMVRRHYLGKWPGVVVAVLGLYDSGEPVGVIVFALPPREVCVRYGGLTWELARLWVDDGQPCNTESWFIARAIRYVKRFHRDVHALVSYADSGQGHTGVIYKASNWIIDGMTDDERKTPRFHYESGGRSYARRSHIPTGDDVQKVYRSRKYRFWLKMR